MSDLPLKKRAMPLLMAFALIVADQVTKALVVRHIPYRSVGFSLWNDFFRLIHVRNTGVAFSLGHGLPDVFRTIFFILLPLAVLAYLAYYTIRPGEESLLERYYLGGIVGGGFGNLIDRIFRPDGVVDFLDVRFYGLFGMERFPTFNVADSSIVICGFLLFLTLLKKEGLRRPGLFRRRRNREEE